MADATPLSARDSSFARGAVIAILGLALVLRLVEYLQGRALWQDEAMIALNLGRHSFPALLGGLQYGQVAPPLFLWAVEAVTRVGGMSEYALRFVPLVVGLLIPWLIWRSAKELAGTEAALIATALAAISVTLIRYSAEVKQYGVDAFVTIALVFLTGRVRAELDRGSRWWQLFGAGLAGMAVSFSAGFILAGCLASLLADSLVRSERTNRRRLLLLGGGLAAGFGVLYARFYLPAANHQFMLFYWGETFLKLGVPGFGRRLYRLAMALTDPFPALPDQLQVRVQSAVIVLGGLGALRRGGRPAAAQLLVPFAAFIAGALITPFPIAARLQLFLAPLSFIAAGVVVAETLRRARRHPNAVASVGVLLVVGWGGPGVLAYLKSPAVVADSREPARLVIGAADLDPVYVTLETVPLWAFYSTDWTRPDQARLDRLARGTSGVVGSNGRLELVGAPSGMMFMGVGGYSRRAPSPGWAASEAGRIAEAANPSVWVFSSMGNTALVDSLRLEFVRRGMAINEIRKGKKTTLLRVFAPSERRIVPP